MRMPDAEKLGTVEIEHAGTFDLWMVRRDEPRPEPESADRRWPGSWPAREYGGRATRWVPVTETGAVDLTDLGRRFDDRLRERPADPPDVLATDLLLVVRDWLESEGRTR